MKDDTDARQSDEDEWDHATFTPLADGAFVAMLADRCVRTMAEHAGFREEFIVVAAPLVEFSQASLSTCRVLRLVLPLGAGTVEYEWDGSAAGAEWIVTEAATTAARTLKLERSSGSSTGWER